MISKDCGWGYVDYSSFFYTEKNYRKCQYCKRIIRVENDGSVIYSGGTMYNSCCFCGAPFEEDKRNILK